MDDVQKEVEFFPLKLGRVGTDPEFEPIQFLRDLHEQKLYILSVFGPKNTGKSFLMNNFITENKYKRFTLNINNEEEEQTTAIYIYNTKLTIGNKEVIIIDCEGLVAAEPDPLAEGETLLSEDDNLLNNRYFQTLVLISSMVIFNCLYAYEEMSEYVKKYTKIFNDLSDKFFNEFNNEKLDDYANFIWVNRDIEDESDGENFEKLFKEEMKDNIFFKNNKILSTFNFPCPMGFSEFQEYQNCNSELECDVEMTNEMNPQASDEFKEKFESFQNFIADKLELKTYSGLQVFGEAYSEMIQDYYDNLAKAFNTPVDPVALYRECLNNNLRAVTDDAAKITIPNEVRNIENKKEFEYKDILELFDKSKEIIDKIASKYMTTYLAKLTKQNNIDLLTEEFKKLYLSAKTALKNKYNYEKNNLNKKVENYKNDKESNSNLYLENNIQDENFVSNFLFWINKEILSLFKDDYFKFYDIFEKNLLPCICEKFHKAFTMMNQINNDKITDLQEKLAKKEQIIQTKEAEKLEMERKNFELETQLNELQEKSKEEKKQLEDKISSLEQIKANAEDIFNKTKEDKEKTINNLKQQLKELNHKIMDITLSNKSKSKDLFFDNSYLEKNAQKTLSLKTMYLQSKLAVNELVERVDSFINNKDLYIQSCFAEESNREINENSNLLFETSLNHAKEKNDLRLKKLNEEKDAVYKQYLDEHKKFSDLNFVYKKLESDKLVLEEKIKNFEKEKEIFKNEKESLKKHIEDLNENLKSTVREFEDKEAIYKVDYYNSLNKINDIDNAIQQLYSAIYAVDNTSYDYRQFMDAIQPLEDDGMQINFIDLYIKVLNPKKKISVELNAMKNEILKKKGKK